MEIATQMAQTTAKQKTTNILKQIQENARKGQFKKRNCWDHFANIFLYKMAKP